MSVELNASCKGNSAEKCAWQWNSRALSSSHPFSSINHRYLSTVVLVSSGCMFSSVPPRSFLAAQPLSICPFPTVINCHFSNVSFTWQNGPSRLHYTTGVLIVYSISFCSTSLKSKCWQNYSKIVLVFLLLEWCVEYFPCEWRSNLWEAPNQLVSRNYYIATSEANF